MQKTLAKIDEYIADVNFTLGESEFVNEDQWDEGFDAALRNKRGQLERLRTLLLAELAELETP